MDNLYIIGCRGSGKTTVSSILAGQTSKKVIHMDAELEKRIGDISNFVQKNTWKDFRKKEASLLKELSAEDDIIVDCGGGIVEVGENINIIKKTGHAVFLNAGQDTIAERLGKDEKKRPSLTGKGTIEEIKEIAEKRIDSYRKTADLEIDTDGKEPEEIAKEILWGFEISPRVAVCINEKTADDAISKIKQLREIKLIEIRIDFIQDINEKGLEKIIESASGKKIIVTNRMKAEGGKFAESETDRISLLKKAIELGADFVDVEFFSRKANELMMMKGKTKIICSYHNFEKLPDDLEELYEKMRRTGADIIKVACVSTGNRDNLRIFGLGEKARKDKVGFIGIAMGAAGKLSRVVNLFSNNEIAGYVSSDSSKSTAPGQLSLEDMKKIYMMVK